MCYKIRNVNDLNVKTQTTKRALFVNYIIVALRRTASMAHAQYGHHFAVTTAPVYVRYVEPNHSSTHSIQENITTIRMRNKQMERTEIAYGWEKKKNCNVCLTVFLCLNEANENKGEAACRILNSSHCESCYSMYTNRIFFSFFGIFVYMVTSTKATKHRQYRIQCEERTLLMIQMSYWTFDIVYDFWTIISILMDMHNRSAEEKEHFFYPIECIMLNIIGIFYQNMEKKNNEAIK